MKLFTLSRRDLYDAKLDIRARRREIVAWKKAATRADEPLSLWIRKRLNLAATPASEPIPPVVSGPQLPLPRIK